MTTISEDYVSFETAKLLKEKGFNEQTRFCFRRDGKILHNDESYVGYPGYYPRPTLQMVMKWLREVHNLIVNPVTTSAGTRCYGEWEADIYYRDSGIDATINACGHIYGETYEEACDTGIRYCLKHLITYETKT